MGHDDLDNFNLDHPSVTKPRLAVSHPAAAATPSSLLSLRLPVSASRTTEAPSSPSSPTLIAPPSPSRFPFPAAPPSVSPAAWSPAFTDLADRPRICVNIDLLDPSDHDSPSASLATPPSPLGLPGTFAAWRRRSSIPGSSPTKSRSTARDALEGELLLPPPFLDEADDADSRKSFEGILGWRSARQAERVRLEHERLYRTGRSPPLPFPQSLFKGFGKLVAILGPPGGYESSAKDRSPGGGKRTAAERVEKQQRRRVQRAESGLRGYDLGAKVGGDVAGRLRRRTSARTDKSSPGHGEREDRKLGGSTATPTSIFAAHATAETSLQSRRPTLLSPSIDTILSTETYFPSTAGPTSLFKRSRYLDLAVWIMVGSFDSLDSVGGVIGSLVHLFGFSFFVASHSAALAASSIVAVRAVAIFLYWMSLNLSGRTEISKAVIAYWRTCRKEWDRVCVEEEGGRGLSAYSVMRGLAELAALHSMTRSRWLNEELNLLESESVDTLDAPQKRPTVHVTRRPSVKKSQSPRTRPSFTMHRSSFRWNRGEDDEEADGLVVTSNAGSLLEGTLITSPVDGRPLAKRKTTFSPQLVPCVVDEVTEEPAPLDPLDPALSSASPRMQAEPDYQGPEFISLLKRCGRLSTAAYGLQTYIVSPPTPLLTPSGATLPHRLFAHLGGVKDHRNVLHVALQKSSDSSDIQEVYAPTFYLLRDDSRRQVVVVFRGTQSLADIKTDLEGDFVSLTLSAIPPDPPDASRSTSYRIHAGILAAARHLLDPSNSPLFAKLAKSLEETGYDLLLTGHSLGSALASTVALLVSDYDSSSRRWSTSPRSGLPPRRSIRAVTFAHPTTLNSPLAARCAVGSPPLVVSVSLGSDIVTRAGLPQLRELRRTLGRLDRARMSDAGILTDWWAWRGHVLDGAEGTAVEALETAAWRRRFQVEPRPTVDEASTCQIATATPAGKAYHIDQLPSRVADERRNSGREVRDAPDEEDDEALMLGLYEVKDPDSFYRTTLLSSDFIRSHLPKEYLDAVESL
ncbi:hypothetical protein JCM11491_003481 [Sporobolomyces phaffii]